MLNERIVMKMLIIFVFCALIFGCSVAQKPISREQLRQIDKVGIVSSVENEFCYSYIGLTAFNNYMHCEKIDDYPLEEKIVDQVYESARSLTVRRNIPVEKINISVALKSAINNASDMYGNLKVEKFVSLMASEGVLSNYRYLLVVRPDVWQFDETSHPIKGVGVWGRMEKVGHPYIIYQMELVDVVSKEILAVGSTSYRNRDVELPWVEPYDNYEEEDKEKIWNTFENAYKQSIDRGVMPLFYSPGKRN